MSVKSVIRSSVRRALRLVGLASGLVAVPLSASWSAALDPDSCAKLKTEQEGMEKAGLKDIVAKGPDWAKANLPAEKINDIRRWIEVDEQLLFRCPGRHLVNLPLEPDPPPPPQAEDKKGESDKADAPAAAPKPAVPAEKKAAASEKKAPEKKPAPQRKPPVAKANPNAETGDDGEPKPTPKVKSTAKPKVKDDAYKPPAGETSNPFGVN